MNKAEDLAKAHWEYVEEILKTHGVEGPDKMIARRHYITAFIHGYKHGKADGDCTCGDGGESKSEEPEFVPYPGPVKGCLHINCNCHQPDVPIINPEDLF